jgi:levansucrase
MMDMTNTHQHTNTNTHTGTNTGTADVSAGTSTVSTAPPGPGRMPRRAGRLAAVPAITGVVALLLGACTSDDDLGALPELAPAQDVAAAAPSTTVAPSTSVDDMSGDDDTSGDDRSSGDRSSDDMSGDDPAGEPAGTDDRSDRSADPGSDADGDADAPSDTETGGSEPSPLPDSFRFEGALVSHWVENAAAEMALSAENTMPMLDPDTERLIDGVWFWDVWPVRDRSGQVADIDGWTILMGLSADITADRVPGDRHGLATWRAAASRDGETWTDLGPVFPADEALGGRQWAGSAVYDAETGEVTMFYTALGDLPGDAALGDGPSGTPYEDVAYTGGAALDGNGPDRQELVEVAASIDTSGDVPAFVDFTEHEIVLVPDGDLYRTAEQSQAGEGPYVFRDPWWYVDPADGREYLLFAANPAYAPGSGAGVVGLATRNDDGDWIPLPPILSGRGVNSQLERPHVLVGDGGSYELFVSTHGFSFVNGLEGPAGLYGFVGDNLRGRYVPMNESGLVMANPLVAPQQAYSWIVVPTDDGPRILSFVNYVDLGEVTLSEIGDQPPEWQREHFVGTPAPLVALEIGDDGDTRVGGLVPLDELAGE